MAHNVASALDHLWEIGFRHLSEQVAQLGHPWVDEEGCCEDGFDLTLWVRVLRQRWTDDLLTESQRGQLAALRGWTVMMDLELDDRVGELRSEMASGGMRVERSGGVSTRPYS